MSGGHLPGCEHVGVGLLRRLFGRGRGAGDPRRLPAPPALPDPPDLPDPPTLPDPPDGSSPPAQPSADLGELERLIVGDDPVAIEGGRDLVTPAIVPLLAERYWATESWAQRLNIIELTMDQSAPELVEVASDFLRAPVAAGDERTELGKAISLGHFGQQFDHQVADEFDRYMDYYNDRALLSRKVDDALALLGTELVPAAPSEPEPPRPPITGPPNTRLLAAINAADRSAFDRALADGADAGLRIGKGDYETCSAMVYACMCDQWEMALALADAGADVNAVRWGPRPSAKDRGQTPIWWAAGKGRLDVIEELVARGGKVDIPDSHGSTPLHQAASGGHLEVVDDLLRRGADPMAPIYDGRTPFNLAATHGRTEVVTYFLDRGHPPDQFGGGDYTALMLACEQGKIEMARALIAAGADVNRAHPGQGIYAGLRGWTPLVFAVRGGRIKITRFMIEAGADVNHVVTPAGTGRDHGVPEKRVIDFVHGRQADRLREILIEAGAEPPAAGSSPV